MKLLIVDLLIPILNLKQGLSVCNGELGDCRTCVKNSPVHCDVVAVHVLQDALVFKAPLKHLLARPCCTLHPKVLRRVAVIVGALDLINVPHVAVVCLDAFAWLQTVQ
jgi:hypothetical protein